MISSFRSVIFPPVSSTFDNLSSNSEESNLAHQNSPHQQCSDFFVKGFEELCSEEKLVANNKYNCDVHDLFQEAIKLVEKVSRCNGESQILTRSVSGLAYKLTCFKEYDDSLSVVFDLGKLGYIDSGSFKRATKAIKFNFSSHKFDVVAILRTTLSGSAAQIDQRKQSIDKEILMAKKFSDAKGEHYILDSKYYQGSKNKLSTLRFQSISPMGKDYFQWRFDKKDPPSDKLCLKIMTSMVKELKEFHKLGYVHRDIKSENFLIFDDDTESPRVELIDFGLSTDSDFRKFSGTVCYLPVEALLRFQRPGVESCYDSLEGARKGDIHALGIVFYETLLAQYHPIRKRVIHCQRTRMKIGNVRQVSWNHDYDHSAKKLNNYLKENESDAYRLIVEVILLMTNNEISQRPTAQAVYDLLSGYSNSEKS